jgi:hypothetical protein
MMSKGFVCLLAMAIIVALSITPFFSSVAGQNTSFVYKGVVTNDTIDPPAVSFSIENRNVENGSVLYDFGNVSLGLVVNIGDTVYSYQEQDTLQTLWVGLTSVSYKASWEDNQTIELYHYSIPTPAILTSFPPNAQSWLSYNLTNIPYGPQQIEVTAVGGGYLWAGSTYSSFSGNGVSSSKTLDFTVEAPPAISTISPENQTYNSESIPLLFSVSGDYASLEYSLDNLGIVTIDGNTTLTDLPYGNHSLAVYASDTLGNTVDSKTIHFATAQPVVNPLDLFPILVVVFVIVLLIALIIYRKRRPKTKLSENRQSEDSQEFIKGPPS